MSGVSPPPSAAHLDGSRLRRLQSVIGELWRFGVVGTLGFVVDSAVLYAAIAAGSGLYLGRLLSYLVAATTTWALNRAWTFRHRRYTRLNAGQQWGLFVLVNLGGFTLNYGTYAILIEALPLVAAHPVIGVAAGSIAGMLSNFLLSRQLVFR